MKIVKEHIYEKFTDIVTDPIKDMGIGQDALDKKLIEETDWAVSDNKIKQDYDIVEVIHNYKGYPILILKDKKHNRSLLPPFRAISVVGVFGIYQNTRNKALKDLASRIDVEIETERISHEIRIKSQKPSPNYTKIHERFLDDSDPISDMGIGYAPYRQALRQHQIENKLDALGIDLLAQIQKLFETNNLATIYYLGTHQYEEFGEVSPSAKWIETEILDGHLIKHVDTEWNGNLCTLRLFKTILGKICDISFRGLDHKDRCDRFIGDLQTAVKIYNPSKNESVNEKFSEDSDPIKDMGIGLEHIKKQYKWLILPHYLDGLTKTDKNKVKKAMNAKSDDLFYLGEKNSSFKKSAFIKVYILRIKRLIEKAPVMYKEEYVEYINDKGDITTIITSYDTKIGKIGTFEYTDPFFKEIIQYFGDVDALLTLKPYEIIEHER